MSCNSIKEIYNTVDGFLLPIFISFGQSSNYESYDKFIKLILHSFTTDEVFSTS